MTILVAVIGLAGPLSSQRVNAANQRKLAAIDRDAKRAERQLQSREDTCAKFLVAARTFQSAARSTSDADTLEPSLNAVREAAAYIELNAADLADGPSAAVVAAAERWHRLLQDNPATAPVITEADVDYQQALISLRDRMRQELRPS